jgi:hypothetical protein
MSSGVRAQPQGNRQPFQHARSKTTSGKGGLITVQLIVVFAPATGAGPQ